jgi:hypothetical protein
MRALRAQTAHIVVPSSIYRPGHATSRESGPAAATSLAVTTYAGMPDTASMAPENTAA